MRSSRPGVLRWLVPLLIALYMQAKSQNVVEAADVAEWGEWGMWSTCTRPCGLGITTRYRVCNQPERSFNEVTKRKTNCVGQYKQYQTCNTQDCPPGTKDFRTLQCERFNNRLVGGRRYSWEPFYSPNQDACELSCRARGLPYFAKMSSLVIDGTPCGDRESVCINGKCESIGCDGVLGSDKEMDKCGVCGGDDTTCHIISGIFTRTKLPFGYNHVARIPKGACNINITELYSSPNYLALRRTHGDYIINGNWKLGYSKDYAAAGSTIRYYRPTVAGGETISAGNQGAQRESILIQGPTNSSLDVLVVRQDDNRGIMYSFTIPMTTPISHDKDESDNNIQADDSVPANPQYNVAPNSNSLSYKTAPKYVKPDYDNERFEQTQALNKDATPQEPSAADRNRKYMDELRKQQRQRAERRHQRHSRTRSSDSGAANSRSGTHHRSQAPANTLDNRRASVRTYNRPESAAQPHESARSRYANDNVKYNAAEGASGVQYNNDQSRTNRVPVPVSENNDRASNADASRVGNTQSRDRYSRVYPQRGYSPTNNAQRGYQANGNPQNRYIYNANQAPVGYQGNGVVSQGANQNGYSVPYRGSVNGGANADVNRQPLQPGGYNRQVYTPGTYRDRYQRYQPFIQRSPTYLNRNQAPVYIPNTYDNQRGTQGFQAGNKYDPSLYNPNYPQGGGGLSIPSNGNVQLGTLDVSAEYSWKISGFTECSRTCGGGTQTTIIVCVKVDSQAVVTDNNCDANKPTPTTVTCNNLQCPPGWALGFWSDCSTSCGRGTQTRTVECKQRISNVLEISVSASRCTHERRPESKKICNEDRPCVRWTTGDWGQCSAECGRGQRSRQVLCVDAQDAPVPDNKCNTPKPPTTEICDMGSCAQTWFFTEWTSECSETCGEGVQRRSVSCGAADNRCSAISKPNAEKPCDNEMPCGGKWFTGPWGECSVTCGQGAVTRDVVCMKKLGRALTMLGEENCALDMRPESSEPCEAVPCMPSWFMTEWSECTRECDTGTQTREVKCLTSDQQQSTACVQALKPEVRQACNTQKCMGEGPSYEKSVIDPGCTDEFKNCQLVVQARLCIYDYYKGLCCRSCDEYERHNPSIES